MTKELIITNEIFESIKHIDSEGNEYWYARELQKVLEYKQWRRFEETINRAKIACEKSGYDSNDHFANVGKMVTTGDSKRKITDYKLSRYACYLIAQNGDPRKEVIALAQTYFAVQTRKMELTEMEYEKLSETDKRFYQRGLIKKGNRDLNKEASLRGVRDFERFTNAGYRGLYGGETANDIAKRKGLGYREDILDNMGSEELASNLFRITQTEAKLKNDNIKGEDNAIFTHYDIARDIRKFIKDHGGTMPEDLPTPKKSLKVLEKERKRSERLLKEEKLKTAKSLLSIGIDINKISKATNLSIKEIENLNNNCHK